MLQSYVKIALRNVRRTKMYSAINIAGLAVGMACCLVLALFVREQMSFDADVPNAERIYRITPTIIRKSEGTSTKIPNTQFPLAPTLKAEMPELERAVRLNAAGSVLFANGQKKFLEKRMMYADNGYFQLFPAEFIAGDAATALANPKSMVLTEATAQKYFGDANPLGKTLRVNNEAEYTVTGIIKNLPQNRHLRFDALVSMQTLLEDLKRNGADMSRMWFAFGDQYTYIQLKPEASVLGLKQKFPAFVERNIGTLLKRIGRDFTLDVQPLRDIHLYPLQDEIQPQGSMQTLKITGAIALIILVLACINFVNLSTARSMRRAQEVGMRKVFGALRWQLVMQFLSESVLISMVALGLALVMVEVALPFVNALMETHLSVGYVSNIVQMLVFVAFAFAVGVCAGTYPALVLSGFTPVRVLKGAFIRTGRSGALRKGLVVMQFTISIALVTGTIVVLRQLEYAQTKELGFMKEQVLTLSLPADSAFAPRKESMKAALKAIAGVQSVAGADFVPGDEGVSRNPIVIEGSPMEKSVLVSRFFVDEDFIPTMGLTMAEGRNFNPSMPTDASDGFLLNEAAAKALGTRNGIGSLIGTRLEWHGGERTKGTVIGVVKDFHYQSLHTAIAPAIFIVNKGDLGRFVIRMNTKELRGTMAQIENVWREFAPNGIVEYSFVDENFNKLYKSEQRTGRIVTVFAGLAVFIACLGLFGLAAFSAEVRTKEIGVRKVLGASVSSIVGLLSKDFLKLVGIAIVVAIPLAYWAAGQWLQDFAYRIDLSVWIFVTAGILALVVALATVSYQALRAATANPVKALRSE